VPAGTKWVRSWSGKMLELLLLILAAIVCGEWRSGKTSSIRPVPCAPFRDTGSLAATLPAASPHQG
jgi:hypothetical protein